MSFIKLKKNVITNHKCSVMVLFLKKITLSLHASNIFTLNATSHENERTKI